MILARWRRRTLSSVLLSLIVLLVVGCGDSAAQKTVSPTPTPVLTQGQALLAQTANALTSAKTLQGMFNLTITGQAISGTLNTEVWNAAPARNRAEVRRSTLPQIPTGTVTVTDGTKTWQYDPVKNIVYSGPAQSTSAGTSGLSGAGNNQGQFVVNLVQTVFTHSNGTLKSASTSANGHAVYDIGVVPQASVANAGSNSFDYTGDVYIDKVTHLPVKVNLNIASLGQVVVDLTSLVLNQPIAASTFTFVTPAGAKMLPLQQATQTASGDQISLAQAQAQAGFHLLSIPGDQADYVLQGVTILGAPGSQIYTLHYMKGSTSFTIAQGKPLANLSASGGQQVSMRGTTATFVSQNGNNVLTWTEKGVGVNITGALSNELIMTIGRDLS